MNVNEKMFPLIEHMLDLTAKRQQTISANLANIDTPGYRAQDASFSEQLQSLTMETSSPRHMSPIDDSGVRVYEVGGNGKENGNNVDLDREMTELTRNGLQYVALVQFLNQKFKTLRTAITEGGKG